MASGNWAVETFAEQFPQIASSAGKRASEQASLIKSKVTPNCATMIFIPQSRELFLLQ